MIIFKILKYLCGIEFCQTNCFTIKCCNYICFTISCKKKNNFVSIDEEWKDMLKDNNLFVIENESSDDESYNMEL